MVVANIAVTNYGLVTQLGECYPCKVEVVSSNLIRSTIKALSRKIQCLFYFVIILRTINHKTELIIVKLILRGDLLEDFTKDR